MIWLDSDSIWLAFSTIWPPKTTIWLDSTQPLFPQICHPFNSPDPLYDISRSPASQTSSKFTCPKISEKNVKLIASKWKKAARQMQTARRATAATNYWSVVSNWKSTLTYLKKTNLFCTSDAASTPEYEASTKNPNEVENVRIEEHRTRAVILINIATRYE